jgi:hypothetical protein
MMSDVGRSTEDDFRLMGHLIQFVALILGLPAYQMSYTMHSQGKYGKSVDFKIKPRDRDDIVIKLDLVHKEITTLLHSRLPVSVGSSLEMVGNGGVRFRRDNKLIQRRLLHWDVTDVVELLKNGQDVKLCLNTTSTLTTRRKVYRNYYWCRITKMVSFQWHFVAMDGSEPPALSEQELEHAVRELTSRKLSAAARVVE